MDFLGIGGGEILLILVVALLIFGPNKIVEIGRTLGKTVNAFKKAASDMTVKVEKELEEQKKEQTGQKTLMKQNKESLIDTNPGSDEKPK